ncbi:hypothetical protein EVAR_14192_1 [Eumeta japonica]|uniref:Scavenger receptor class B member 1 n=1 Tax=Eumeta variegata TaxID=151549 RepID=A0A4C1UEU1_EUMVA|nr:hypothetical protein EVAR_14192_1 [Eumeta japonica]
MYSFDFYTLLLPTRDIVKEHHCFNATTRPVAAAGLTFPRLQNGRVPEMTHHSLEKMPSTALMLPKENGDEKVVIITPRNGVGKILIREDTILANLQGCAGCGRTHFACARMKGQWSVLCWGKKSEKKHMCRVDRKPLRRYRLPRTPTSGDCRRRSGGTSAGGAASALEGCHACMQWKAVLFVRTSVKKVIVPLEDPASRAWTFGMTPQLKGCVPAQTVILQAVRNMVLRNNSLAFKMWQHPTVQPVMKVHIFNYTNWENVKNGYEDKLVVEDVGPYVYQIINTRGRKLKKNLDKNNFTTISKGEPTNRSNDLSRLPDSFQSFLHREGFVETLPQNMNVPGEFNEITAEVPQGLVLGSVLYTMFSSDIPQCPDVTIVIYADNTAILNTTQINVKLKHPRCYKQP